MTAPSEDVKTILLSDSTIGLALGTDLFISTMPADPDECVAVYDSGGENSEAQYNYQRPTVQIRVRGNRGEYNTTYALADSIRNLLHGLANYTVGSVRYVGIWAQGDILFIHYDENQRPVFSMNFILHRTTT